MLLTVLLVPGCPNADQALATARLAASSVGGITVERVVVTSTDQAIAAGFAGSPSFHLDGADLFPGAEAGVSCRLYRSQGTVTGCPSSDDLVDALTRAVG